MSAPYKCEYKGVQVVGSPMKFPQREWLEARKRIHGEPIEQKCCLATGRPIRDDEILVAIIGNGSALGCNFTIPQETIETIGFEPAVQRAGKFLEDLCAQIAELTTRARLYAIPGHRFGCERPDR